MAESLEDSEDELKPASDVVSVAAVVVAAASGVGLAEGCCASVALAEAATVADGLGVGDSAESEPRSPEQPVNASVAASGKVQIAIFFIFDPHVVGVIHGDDGDDPLPIRYTLHNKTSWRSNSVPSSSIASERFHQTDVLKYRISISISPHVRADIRTERCALTLSRMLLDESKKIHCGRHLPRKVNGEFLRRGGSDALGRFIAADVIQHCFRFLVNEPHK